MHAPRMTLLLTAAVSVGGLSFPCGAGAQATGAQAFVGTWEGVLDVGVQRLRLIMHVSRSEDGSLSGTMDSPDQSSTGIPASEVTASGAGLHFAVDRLAMTYVASLSADGDTLSGTFAQGGLTLPLTLHRSSTDPAAAAAAPPERPQEPRPPFPYRTEDVRVESAPGVTLAGTLTLPPGDGPFPAAVLVTGSGAQDRDETIFGHKPFLLLADHLTRAGIAVLRCDDRGVGESTGSPAQATSEDFTTDALSAVAFLKARADIGPVGIIGHSEGGLIGPMAAVRSDDVAFVVMLAGPGITGEEIVTLQGALIARAEGATEETVASNRRTQETLFDIVKSQPDTAEAAIELRTALRSMLDSVPEDQRRQLGEEATTAGIETQIRQLNSPWFRFFLTYDPRPTLERVRVPVLALFGEKDLQVPAEVNLREVRSALERGGDQDVTVRVMPGLNHLFQRATTGSPSEYATISQTMDPSALEAVSEWIVAHFGHRR